MSSILEALERAEQERNARGPAQRKEPLSRPKPLWQRPILWLFGAGLIMVNFAIWWLLIDTGSPPEIAELRTDKVRPESQPVVPQATPRETPPPARQVVEVTPAPSQLAPVQVSPAAPQPPVEPVSNAQTQAETNAPPLFEAALPSMPIAAVKAQPLARSAAVPSVEQAVPKSKDIPAAVSAKLPVQSVTVEPKPAVKADQSSVPKQQIAAVTPAVELPKKAAPVVAPEAKAKADQSSVPKQQIAAVTPAVELAKKAPIVLPEPEVKTDQVSKSEKPEVPAEEPVPEAAGKAVVEAVQTAVVEEPRIPEIWELPAKIQKKLKNIEISIHVYNEVAAERFVIIDMRRYREGDPLARQGLKLDRITREGVVIDYGDGKVKI